jgi:hypothetical protein
MGYRLPPDPNLANPGRANTVPGAGKGTGRAVVGAGAPNNGGYVPKPTTLPNGAVATLTKGTAGIDNSVAPIDVQALRSMLVKYGYNIPKSGNAPGSLFKAALKDFLQPDAQHPVSQRLMALLGIDKGHFASGLRDPHSFNAKFGLLPGGKTTPPTKTPSTRLTPNGDLTPAATADTFGAPSDPPAVDLSGLDGLDAIAAKLGVKLSNKGYGGLNPNTGQMLSTAGLDGLNPNVGQRIDPAMADKLAGLQYDGQIHDEGVLGERQKRDAAQSLGDIGNWYGQALKSQTAAAGRDTAISQAGQKSVGDAVANIVASLGGSANQGSGLVGAAGADSVGTLAALGANEDQYNADLAPLLKTEQAGSLSRQSAKNTSDAQDIAQKIVDLKGQRGQTKAEQLMNIINANNGLDQSRFGNAVSLEQAKNQVHGANNDLSQTRFGNTMGIAQAKQQTTAANNALSQQRFQDSLALEQSREAAALTGAKVIDAQTKAYTAANKPVKPAHGSFGASSSQDRTNYTKDLLSQIAPNGQLPKGMTRSKAQMIANRLAAIYFPHGGVPNGTGYIKSILAQAGL